MNNKKNIALLCFLTDIGIAIWSYFSIKNYDQYLKIVKPIFDSPDFQVQLYKVFLQSFIISMLLFLILHLVIYILFIREVKYAIKYVRFYSFMAAISSLIMIFTGYPVGVLPFIIYSLVFISVKKSIKS